MIHSVSEQSSAKLPQVSLGKLLQEYRLDLEAANRSPKTISRYMYTLSGLADFLESNRIAKPVSELGRKDISAYVRHLQNSGKWPNRVNDGKNLGKLSPYTVQGHVRDFKAFWSWLTSEGYVEKNMLAGFPLPKVPQYVIKTLTYDHVKKLFSAIDRSTALGARYYCVLMLLLEKAMSVSKAQIGSVFILDAEKEQLRVVKSMGLEMSLTEGSSVSVKESLARMVVYQKKPLPG